MAAEFEPRLMRLFEEKEIHADISTFLKGDPMKITTLDDFATLCDAQSEIQATILSHVASKAKDLQQLYRLKQAWRFAHDEYERRSERRRQGWSEDVLDDPLGPEDTQEKYTNFTAPYHFTLRSWDCGSDALLGRITREADRWTMTFMVIDKVRDLKNTQVLQQSKKQKLAEGVVLVTDRQPEEEGFISTATPYLHALRVYCNTLVVGGNKKVNSKLDTSAAGRDIVYAPLSQCWGYVSYCEERVMTFATRHPKAAPRLATDWLRRADEATRTKVMELVRTSPKNLTSTNSKCLER